MLQMLQQADGLAGQQAIGGATGRGDSIHAQRIEYRHDVIRSVSRGNAMN